MARRSDKPTEVQLRRLVQDLISNLKIDSRGFAKLAAIAGVRNTTSAITLYKGKRSASDDGSDVQAPDSKERRLSKAEVSTAAAEADQVVEGDAE